MNAVSATLRRIETIKNVTRTPLPGPRAAQSAGSSSAIEDMIRESLRLLDGVTFDPSIKAVRTWTQGLADDPVTVSWALLYGTSHLGEHVGHLHMTLELLRPAD